MSEAISAAQTFFGENYGPDDFEITPKHIHTRALGYDRYEPSDHTDYLVVTLNAR